MHLSPAEYVIHIFGGVRATARVFSMYPASVSKWRYNKDKNGESGYIPRNMQKRILARAKELQLDVTPHDLIYGREVKVYR